jgi:hypothetical protein
MLIMLIFASQTFANGVWTVTPEEPGALTLALVGLGTLACYAVFTGWRPTRKTLANISASGTQNAGIETETPGTIIRRAA